MKTRLLLVSSLVIALNSCNKEDEKAPDTAKPVIEITSPKEHQHYAPGDTIHVKGEITDNENLSSYKIEVHNAEGHDHKSGSRGGTWEHNHTESIDGKSYTLSQSIVIEKDADTAEYHFIVNALDAAGNAAEFVEMEIEVK